ncbi:MAG: helicase C-terminal domain-containing protein [Eubacteriales bacterium]
MDIAGDVLSSVIIVKLPFPIPSPISENERKEIGSDRAFREQLIIPAMLLKLQQWVGRGIRAENDTCVFSILDSRASEGYYGYVKHTLSHIRVTKKLKEVEKFIKTKKRREYFESNG